MFGDLACEGRPLCFTKTRSWVHNISGFRTVDRVYAVGIITYEGVEEHHRVL